MVLALFCYMDRFSQDEVDNSKVIGTMTIDLNGLTHLLQECSNSVLAYAKGIEHINPNLFDPDDYMIELQFGVRENPEDLWGEKRHQIMGLRVIAVYLKE